VEQPPTRHLINGLTAVVAATVCIRPCSALGLVALFTLLDAVSQCPMRQERWRRANELIRRQATAVSPCPELRLVPGTSEHLRLLARAQWHGWQRTCGSKPRTRLAG